jgi:hypothetical protein
MEVSNEIRFIIERVLSEYGDLYVTSDSDFCNSIYFIDVNIPYKVTLAINYRFSASNDGGFIISSRTPYFTVKHLGDEFGGFVGYGAENIADIIIGIIDIARSEHYRY